MARLIEPTPILRGEDAANFYLELERKKTKEEIERKNKLLQESKSIFLRHHKFSNQN